MYKRIRKCTLPCNSDNDNIASCEDTLVAAAATAAFPNANILYDPGLGGSVGKAALETLICAAPKIKCGAETLLRDQIRTETKQARREQRDECTDVNKCCINDDTRQQIPPPCRNLHLLPHQDTLRRVAWWSQPSLQNIGIGIAILFLFIVLTAQFAHHWREVSPDLVRAVQIYLFAFRSIAVVAGFYLLALGVSTRSDVETLGSQHQNSADIEGLIVEYYPYSVRLYKSIYPTDPFLRAVVVPPLTDVGERNWVEIIICNLMFISIDNVLLLSSIPNEGFIGTWRSWFRSPIVREQWAARRPFFNDAMVRFVEQMLFPDAPMPCPSVWARATQNTLIVALAVVTLVVLIGSVAFWITWCFPTLGDMIFIYFEGLEALFLGAVILVLVYDVSDTSNTGLEEFNIRDKIDVEETFLEGYPTYVLLYQQMYQENCRLQAIRAPVDETNFNLQLMAFASMAGVLFQTIDSVLLLTSTTPDPSYVRLWRSWFQSCIIHTLWPSNRSYFTDTAIAYIDRMRIYTKRSPCVCARTNEQSLQAAIDNKAKKKRVSGEKEEAEECCAACVSWNVNPVACLRDAVLLASVSVARTSTEGESSEE